MPEARLGDAVGKAVQVDRPVVEVREHRRCHAGVVADQVALGQRSVRLLRGEQHLVEVRQLQRVLTELPLAALARARRVRRARPASARPRSWCSTMSRRALPSPRRSCGLTSPSGDGPRDPNPSAPHRRACGAAATGCLPPLLPPRRTSAKRPLSFSPSRLEVEVALLDRLRRRVALGQLPGAPVPHDDVAAAVLASGMTPSKSK